MIDSSKYKNKKIQEIKEKISSQPLYSELFNILGFSLDEDFMQAELLLEQIEIGDSYIKISEPTVKILDFFKKKNFMLKNLLPAHESENYKYPVTAWLIKE
jgi:hypothetical protein